MSSPITMDMAKTAVEDVIKSRTIVISSDYIQEVVSKYFNVNKEDLKSAKRSSDITFPRQIAMYLCKTVAQMSLSQIGKDFGNRDHSTVLHAVNKIEKEINSNPHTKLIVESVENLLTAKN